MAIILPHGVLSCGGLEDRGKDRKSEVGNRGRNRGRYRLKEVDSSRFALPNATQYQAIEAQGRFD